MLSMCYVICGMLHCTYSSEQYAMLHGKYTIYTIYHIEIYAIGDPRIQKVKSSDSWRGIPYTDKIHSFFYKLKEDY